MTISTDQADWVQERMADYRIFDVAGEHYEIGRYLGRATPLRVVPDRSAIPPDIDYARACLQRIGQFHPGLEAEYRGFAAAKAVPLEEVLTHVSLNVTNGQIGQCSTIGFRNATGHIIVGRNYDFRYRQHLRYLIHTHPPGYAAHCGTNSGLIGGRYDGVNEYGVFVSLHTVMADRPKQVSPGIPFHLVVRIALETSDSARAAMNTIRMMPVFHSFNYFVADKNEMFLIETHPSHVEVTGGKASIIAVTNHYQHPALQKLHGKRTLRQSRQRLAYLRQQAQAWTPAEAPITTTQRLLQDHTIPICGHQDGAATLWSAVCVPAEHKLAYAFGAPCRNPYQDLPWPGAGWELPSANSTFG